MADERVNIIYEIQTKFGTVKAQTMSLMRSKDDRDIYDLINDAFDYGRHEAIKRVKEHISDIKKGKKNE